MTQWPGAWAVAAGGLGLMMYAALRGWGSRETRLKKKQRVRRRRQRARARKNARGIHDLALIQAIFARGGDEAAEAYIAARNARRPRSKRLGWIRDGKA